MQPKSHYVWMDGVPLWSAARQIWVTAAGSCSFKILSGVSCHQKPWLTLLVNLDFQLPEANWPSSSSSTKKNEAKLRSKWKKLNLILYLDRLKVPLGFMLPSKGVNTYTISKFLLYMWFKVRLTCNGLFSNRQRWMESKPQWNLMKLIIMCHYNAKCKYFGQLPTITTRSALRKVHPSRQGQTVPLDSINSNTHSTIPCQILENVKKWFLGFDPWSRSDPIFNEFFSDTNCILPPSCMQICPVLLWIV